MAQASEQSETLQSGCSQEKASLTWLYPAFLTIVGLAAAVRLPGCFSDFWLDEIWTLFIANQLNSPVQIFTEFSHSANQHLNTLIFYLLGDREHWIVYRIHSLVTGIGTVVLAWFIAHRTGKFEATIASVLMAASYLMIHFSSEARGYGLVVFFAFATFFAVQRFVENRSWLWAIVFWICVCLGVLSHLTYLHVFIAVTIWFLAHLFKTCENKLEVIVCYAQCFGVPIMFLGCLYAFVIRHFVIGAGPPYKLIDVLVKTLSYAGGGPAAGPVAVMVSVITAGLLLWAIVWLRRQGRSEWIFYLIVIFLSPVVLLAVKCPDVLFVRYFLISIAFGFIAISHLMADLCRRGHLAKMWVSILLLLFLVGNGVNVYRLFKYGRGSYLEGLRYMADHALGEVITMGSDHDFRNGMLVEYYNRYLSPGKRITYIPQHQYPAQGPTWMISHRIGNPGKISPIIVNHHGNTYKLVKTLPYSDLSGWHWFLYRNAHIPS